MEKKCKTTGTIVGIIRIALGLFMLYMGIMKLGASTEVQTMIGGAGAAMGLAFLSASTWFWIAVVGEFLSAILLLTGCQKLAKVGAILALIIMVFAINAAGFAANNIFVIVTSLVVIIMGPGCFGVCPCKACKACCGGSCTNGGCDTVEQQQQQQQQQ